MSTTIAITCCWRRVMFFEPPFYRRALVAAKIITMAACNTNACISIQSLYSLTPTQKSITRQHLQRGFRRRIIKRRNSRVAVVKEYRILHNLTPARRTLNIPIAAHQTKAHAPRHTPSRTALRPTGQNKQRASRSHEDFVDEFFWGLDGSRLCGDGRGGLSGAGGGHGQRGPNGLGSVGCRGGLRWGGGGGMRRGCSWGGLGWGLACEYGLEVACCGGGYGGSKRVAGEKGQLRAGAWE